MITRVLDSAFISNFINADFSGDKIRLLSKEYAETFVKKIFNEKLLDWEITFRIYYNNVKQILIYTRGKAYPIEKYKEITIHIPIPIKEHIDWGVNLEQHAYKDENHLDHLIKNFHRLDVDYTKFNNRQDYILDCQQRAIKFCFEHGFTINGVKVKAIL